MKTSYSMFSTNGSLETTIRYELRQALSTDKENRFFFFFFLPGQGSSLHERSIFSFPVHSFPPCAGGGLVQVRDRLWVPTPHVSEHVSQSPQSVQLPSTLKNKRKKKHFQRKLEFILLVGGGVLGC